MNQWNQEDLKSSLEKMKADGKIQAFVASVGETQRQEFYLIQDARTRVALDQARRVDSRKISVTIFVKKSDGRLGRAQKPLILFQPLAPQLEALFASASIGDEEYWEYPAKKERVGAAVNNVFPALKENFERGAQMIQKDLSESIAATEGIFNSAELFVTLEKTTSYHSNGHQAVDERSKIYTEVCFSAEDKGNSEEFLLTQWYGHPEQVNLKRMCADSREFAAASLQVSKPESGKYNVILNGEVLAQIWNSSLRQFDSHNQYVKLPFRELGSEFIAGFSGEPFSLWLDPKKDFCFASRDFDAMGTPQERRALLEGNKVVSSLTDARFAQYLKKPVTTTAGCTVVETAVDGKTLAELRKSRPQVLEILQFSGLFVDDMTLTYSSEIRLARLYDNEKGTVTFIKGGNLSGNLTEDFRAVQWSKEKTLVNHSDYSGQGVAYSGPEYALVSNVSVSS